MINQSPLQELKEYWDRNYSYISLELADDEISFFIESNDNNIRKAASMMADYLLSQGLAEVQE